MATKTTTITTTTKTTKIILRIIYYCFFYDTTNLPTMIKDFSFVIKILWATSILEMELVDVITIISFSAESINKQPAITGRYISAKL